MVWTILESPFMSKITQNGIFWAENEGAEKGNCLSWHCYQKQDSPRSLVIFAVWHVFGGDTDHSYFLGITCFVINRIELYVC